MNKPSAILTLLGVAALAWCAFAFAGDVDVHPTDEKKIKRLLAER